MIKKERSVYPVRFNLTDILVVYKIEDMFVNFLNLFVEEKFNIKLILYAEVASTETVHVFEAKYKDLLDKLKYKIAYNDNDFVWYDIFEESYIDDRNSYKFRNVYSNVDEFIQSTFTFITFIKGIQNKEEEKRNEGRYDRKQFIRKKTTYKENNVGVKK